MRTIFLWLLMLHPSTGVVDVFVSCVIRNEALRSQTHTHWTDFFAFLSLIHILEIHVHSLFLSFSIHLFATICACVWACNSWAVAFQCNTRTVFEVHLYMKAHKRLSTGRKFLAVVFVQYRSNDHTHGIDSLVATHLYANAMKWTSTTKCSLVSLSLSLALLLFRSLFTFVWAMSFWFMDVNRLIA